MTIRIASGYVYTGDTAFDVVEQMRQGDFEPPPTVLDYIKRAVARSSHYFGVTMRLDTSGTEQEVAERFIAAAIAKGFAERVELS